MSLLSAQTKFKIKENRFQGAPMATCTNGITFIALIFSIKLLLLQKCIEPKRNTRTTWRSKYSCFSLWISLRQSSISPSSRESKLNADSHFILQLYLIRRWGGEYCIHEGNDSTFIGGGRGEVLSARLHKMKQQRFDLIGYAFFLW